MDPSFVALAQRCAPSAPVETLAAIAQVESGLNPYALRLNSVRPGSPGVARQPTALKEATVKAKALVAAGHDVELGLMGLPANALPVYGVTLEQAFDPCVSIRLAAGRLRAYAMAAERRGLPRPRAEEAAISAYFGDGDPQVGQEAGYLSRILRARASLQGRIATLTVSPSERPLPDRHGEATDAPAPAMAAPREPARAARAPARLKPEPSGSGDAVPESPAWDVFGSARERSTSILVFSRKLQK